jgi:hypothetical protein
MPTTKTIANRENPTTVQDWNEVWKHFNRMQRRIMADKTSKSEFFAQPESERLEYYRWMQQQCGEYACWM